jgi:hypothetical protein
LYFQSIVDRKIGGTAIRNLRILEGLCGKNALRSVVVVTNMWEQVTEENRDTCEGREREMKGDPEFFRSIVEHGGRFERHDNTKESAQRILSSLIFNERRRKVLAIQREMVDEGLPLDETTAAAVLTRDFDTLIHNLEQRVRREESMMEGGSRRERKGGEANIKVLKTQIKELEERKIKVQKGQGTLLLHRKFLNWVRSKFS